jgi:hypothetical protein
LVLRLRGGFWSLFWWSRALKYSFLPFSLYYSHKNLK